SGYNVVSAVCSVRQEELFFPYDLEPGIDR
ncbi:MAG: hypothetical protein JWN44_1218, partial [Myxococcales bacterium]|nr:hypothetical protein [Myxococcales bacterium]